MFTSIFFLVIALTVINLVPGASSTSWPQDVTWAFYTGIFFFLGCLALIAFQNLLAGKSRLRQDLASALAHVEILGFLILFYFFLGAQRYYLDLPLFQSSLAFSSLIGIAFYFLGLGMHTLTQQRHGLILNDASQKSAIAAVLQNWQFLLPFILPYLAYESMEDLFRYLSWVPGAGEEGLLGVIFTIFPTLIFLALMICFLPALVQRCWGCRTLAPSPLKDRLEQLCRKAKFRNGGLKTWPVLKDVLTAAIIGVLPRFRYIIFTDRILRELPEDEVEAILAHEIGHSYRKHLLIYPFVILGMVVLLGLFSFFFFEGITDYFNLLRMSDPHNPWMIVEPIVLALPFVLIVGLYFRLVFGFFSRNFERQADLHVFHLDIPPENLRKALDRVGTLTGGTHDVPSWHHYGIRQRMDFLARAIKRPEIIKYHHRRVSRLVIAYFALLILGTSILISPFLEDTPLLSSVGIQIRESSASIKNWLNKGLREKLSRQYIVSYDFNGASPQAREALEEAFAVYPASHYPGVAEFYASQLLLGEDQVDASAVLMIGAWERIPLGLANATDMKDFLDFTRRILNRLGSLDLRQRLRTAQEDALTRYRESKDSYEHPDQY